MPHPTIATRSGQPAYLNAPVRKTQAMYDLERRLRARNALSQLASDAEAVGEPGLTLGVLATWSAISALVWGVVVLAVVFS